MPPSAPGPECYSSKTKEIALNLPSDPSTAAARFHELTVDFTISDEQFGALRNLGCGRDEARLRIDFIRAVLSLTTLYRKFHTDPSLKKVFDQYFSDVLHDYDRADVLFYVEHLSRLRDSRYEANLFDRSNGFDPQLSPIRQLIRFCQSEARRIGELADRLFGRTAIATDENFDEHAYLLANPDVANEIEAGRLESARVHFVMWGKNEGRRIKSPGDWPHDITSCA
jgi:hypothetical protein